MSTGNDLPLQCRSSRRLSMQCAGQQPTTCCSQVYCYHLHYHEHPNYLYHPLLRLCPVIKPLNQNRYAIVLDQLAQYFTVLLSKAIFFIDNKKISNMQRLIHLNKSKKPISRFYFLTKSTTKSSNSSVFFTRMSSLLLFLLTVLSCCLCPTVSGRKTLYTAGFFPLSGEKADIGLGILPAVQLALDDITENDVIPGYKLDLVGNDTMCDAAVGMKTFFDMLYAAPKKLILFGDACNTVTDPIAKAARFFNLIQLSYADTHPMYTSDSYPNLFRIAPSESAFNEARLALLTRFKWARVGTIYENSPRYSLPHSKLLTVLDTAKIEIALTQSISEEVQTELVKLKEKDVRIIIGNFGESWARHIFCQAHKHGLYGRKYQWIIAGEYSDFWWTKDEPSMNCSKKELLQAIEGYILTDVLSLSSSIIITASGISASDYMDKYDYLRKEDYSKFHGYAYDGLWAIALAIRQVSKRIRAEFQNVSLDNFHYRDPFWGRMFREALNQTSFVGVTGNVSFVHNERKGSILLKQFQGGREVKIGEFHSTNEVLDLGIGASISWRGGSSPPVDRTIKEIVPSRVSLTLFVVLSVFSVFGIILALVFLLINIKYRKQRYIKMSSPYLNNLIIIGCTLTYTSVILLGLDSRLMHENNFPYICAGRAWVLMTGFTLAFGSMFSKTWRVHAIFTNIKLNKKVIKDYKLFMVVGILVFIDVATLTTWQIVDPFYRQTSLGTPETMPGNEDVLLVPQMEYCQSKRMTIFLGSIYVYKGLLMAFGIFLAWETRHVSIPALNDSKYIGMSVYNVVIMCVIGAGLSVVLRDQQNAAFLIISIFIIFCSTATLCLVFLPKLIELKRNPNMDEKRARPTLKPFKKSRRESDDVELHTRIKMLSDTNQKQRQRLKEKTYELEALMFRLRQLNAEIAEFEKNKNNFPGQSTPSALTGATQLLGADQLTLHECQITAAPDLTIVPSMITTPAELSVNAEIGRRIKPQPNEASGRQLCVVMTEESSSKSNEKETSYLSLSASASFISSADNSTMYTHPALYAHNVVSPMSEPTSTMESTYTVEVIPPNLPQSETNTGITSTTSCLDPSRYEVEIEPHTTINAIVQPQLSVHTHSSCPELAQITQILSLSENQLHCDYVKKLIMMNTNVLPSYLPPDSTTDQPSTQDNAKLATCVHCTPGHRVLKSVSQVEPLSLIEKVREVRLAVQKTLNCRFKDRSQRLIFLTEQEQQSAGIQFPTKVSADSTVESIVDDSAFQPLQLHSEPYANEWSQASTYGLSDLNHPTVELALHRHTKSRIPSGSTSSTQITVAPRRRRTKSLGLLQFSDQLAGVDVDTGRPMFVSSRSHRLGYSGVGGGRLSLIHQPLLSGGHPVHPTTGSYVGRMSVEQLQSTCPSANVRAGFSSSPSIKCDIVEYL